MQQRKEIILLFGLAVVAGVYDSLPPHPTGTCRDGKSCHHTDRRSCHPDVEQAGR